MTASAQTETVAVYVRLCGEGRNEECRELSFTIPDGIGQVDLLEAGFAIDGTSATKSIVPFVNDDEDYIPLSEVLLDAQRDLTRWMSERGHEVVFR